MSVENEVVKVEKEIVNAVSSKKEIVEGLGVIGLAGIGAGFLIKKAYDGAKAVVKKVTNTLDAKKKEEVVDEKKEEPEAETSDKEEK